MIQEISNEMKKFIKDLEENIQNKEDLKYVLDRSDILYKVILKEIKETREQDEKKIKALMARHKKHEKRLKEMESKMAILDENIEQIYKDIYEEEDEEFKITCPYCNYEFYTNIDEKELEILCPECNNTIELDWNDE